MRFRFSVGALLIVSIVSAGAFVMRGVEAAPARQSAIVYLRQPTLIGSTIVQGPVIFIHDMAKMARGEPCTTVRLVEPPKGLAEEVASFHCIPTRRPVVDSFTIKTRPNMDLGFGCILTEFQFAGDQEAHGVPMTANAQ